MLITQITRKGAWTLKTLREQFLGTPPKFLDNLLMTNEKNKADFANLIPQIDSYLYTRIGNLTTMEDTTEYRAYVRAWWYSAVESLNRAYNIYFPATAVDGYNYNPLENYSMSEGTTARHEQGTLKTTGSVDDPARTTANYTSTQDDATSGRLEGYSVSGQGNGVPVSNQTAKIESSSETSYTSKVSSTSHDNNPVTADVLDVVTHDRTGNIGVMSSQDMANQELELRKGHFFNYFCEMFTKDCTSGAWGGGYEM